MSISENSEVFDGIQPDNDAGIDDWKMNKVVEATAGYIIDLSGRWNFSADEIVSESWPLTVKVGDSRASMDEDTVEFVDPDLYMAIMKNNYDSGEVHAAVGEHYPIQFHQVPEEVGQLIGERADNGWEFDGSLESIARDELHGNLAKMEYFPWFVDLQKETWQRDLQILKKMNSFAELQYVEDVQDDIEALRDELESLNAEEGSSFYSEGRKISILYELGELMIKSPGHEIAGAYNSKQENRPQTLSTTLLETYTPIEMDVALQNGEYTEDIDLEGGVDYSQLVDEIEDLGRLSEDELRDLRDSNLEFDSRIDRAYLIASRVAQDVVEDGTLSAEEVINSDAKTNQFLREVIGDYDERVRAEYGL